MKVREEALSLSDSYPLLGFAAAGRCSRYQRSPGTSNSTWETVGLFAS